MSTEQKKARTFWIDRPDFDLGFTQKFVAEFPHKDSLNGSELRAIELTPVTSAAEEMYQAIEHALGAYNDRECNCDGEYVDGRLVGHTCYFHRIEHDLREAVAKISAARVGEK